MPCTTCGTGGRIEKRRGNRARHQRKSRAQRYHHQPRPRSRPDNDVVFGKKASSDDPAGNHFRRPRWTACKESYGARRELHDARHADHRQLPCRLRRQAGVDRRLQDALRRCHYFAFAKSILRVRYRRRPGGETRAPACHERERDRCSKAVAGRSRQRRPAILKQVLRTASPTAAFCRSGAISARAGKTCSSRPRPAPRSRT